MAMDANLTAYYDLARRLAEAQVANQALATALGAGGDVPVLPGVEPVDQQTWTTVIENFPEEDRMAIQQHLEAIQAAVQAQATNIEAIATQVGQLANAGSSSGGWAPPMVLNHHQVEENVGGTDIASPDYLRCGYYNSSSTKYLGRLTFQVPFQSGLTPRRVRCLARTIATRANSSNPWVWSKLYVTTTDSTLWKSGGQTGGFELTLEPSADEVQAHAANTSIAWWNVVEIPLDQFASWGEKFFILSGQVAPYPGYPWNTRIEVKDKASEPTQVPFFGHQNGLFFVVDHDGSYPS